MLSVNVRSKTNSACIIATFLMAAVREGGMMQNTDTIFMDEHDILWLLTVVLKLAALV